LQRVVQPLFRDIALHDAGEERGHGVSGEQKTDGGRNEKERQNVLQFAADVAPVKWALVMIPMERVESFMQEPLNEPFPCRKAAVQNIAVKEVLDERPGHATRRKENHRRPWMRCRKRDNQH